MKKLLAAAAAVVAVVAVAGIWIFVSADSIVKAAIERLGSQVLGTSVRVAAVELDLVAGLGTVRDLRVANPEGFSSGDALAFRELTIQIDPASLTGPVIVLPQIRLKEPRVRLELRADGSSNVDQLRRNAESFAPQTAPASSSASSDSSGDEPVRLRIGELELAEGTIVTRFEDSERETPLPGFELTALGGSSGATPPELAQLVATRLTAQVARAYARSEIGRRVSDAVRERLGDSAAEGVSGVLRSLGVPTGD